MVSREDMTKMQMCTTECEGSLDQVLRKVDGVATLPHVALRVTEVANDPEAGAYELKRVMESDIALSTSVLRYANSSLFPTRTEVTNLQQAIAYLGMSMIRNLAVTAAVGQLFTRDMTVGPYRRAGLWRHLGAVGIGARLIAKRCGIDAFEDAFLAGLLHDIGLVLEDQHCHDAFRTVMLSLDETSSLIDVEQSELGFDHTMLGERAVKGWGLPTVVQAAGRHHHDSTAYAGTASKIVNCVEVANYLCTARGTPSVGLKLIEASQAALDELSIAKEDIFMLSDELGKELAASEVLFKL